MKKYQNWIVILIIILVGVSSPTLAASTELEGEDSYTVTPKATGPGYLFDVWTPQPTATSLPSTATSDVPPTSTPLPMVVQLIVSEPTPVGYGPVDFPFFINPLTGTLPEDTAFLERRPMVVKITNYPRKVRPQSGLSRADIVYEYYMERGVPRFIAVFYGENAEKVGPVRSGRLFDKHIYTMYDGIFVFGSADDRVLNYLIGLSDYGKDTHVYNSMVLESPQDKERECDPERAVQLCRDAAINSYNNMFTNTMALEKYIQIRNGNYRPELLGMRFSERMAPGGTLGMSISTRFSLFMYNKWEYDIPSGRYLRYQEDIGFADPNQTSYVPHIDALTGEQLGAENVVVLIVPHSWFVHTSGTEMLNISLEGEGGGYVFRDGFVFPVTWERPADGGIVQLIGQDGELFPLKPGKTWFEIISQYSETRIDVYNWYFTFRTPPVGDEPINPNALYPPTGIGPATLEDRE